jgi:coniferyl-aldehyde dehydrogenase
MSPTDVIVSPDSDARRHDAPCAPDRDRLRFLFEAQRIAFAAGPPDFARRKAALRALERAVVARQRDIVDAVAEDFGGRAAEETLALELLPLLNELRYARRHLKRWMTPRRARVAWQFWPATARVLYRPLGVVGVVAPWNCPFFLGLGPLAGILAAGNHALLKPSELAPASAAVMQSIVADTFAADYVAVVPGDGQMAAEFTRLPFDHLLFTGSTRVGRLVMQSASETLVPVTLELGGKSPAIVHEDYPVALAAARIAAGKLYNAGQTCVAPDYVLVPRGRGVEFAGALAKAMARLYPTLSSNPDYTRIINAAHYQRLTRLVDDARARGGRVEVVAPPGEACDVTNRVFPPTLVTNVDDGMLVMQQEVFGPVLPVVEYCSLEYAMARIAGGPRPLAMYYFDDDRSRVDRLLERVPAGGVTVNDCLLHVGQPGLPFGGVGASGVGRYHGFDGFERFSSKVGVLSQRRWSPVSLLHPPYTARTRRLLQFLMR